MEIEEQRKEEHRGGGGGGGEGVREDWWEGATAKEME